eukprot:2424589-Lingulodinium_polyedra.AAC.1
MRMALTAVLSAKNRMLRKGGMTPIQVVQGRDDLIPAALMDQLAEGETRMTTNKRAEHVEPYHRAEQIRAAAASAS